MSCDTMDAVGLMQDMQNRVKGRKVKTTRFRMSRQEIRVVEMSVFFISKWATHSEGTIWFSKDG
jgi:hypothetical protein